MYISFFKLLLGKLWRAKLEKNRFSKEGYKGFVYDFYMIYSKLPVKRKNIDISQSYFEAN